MLTIVKDKQCISLTLDADVCVIGPAVHWFRKLARQWKIEDAERLSTALEELLLNAAAARVSEGRCDALRCRIELSGEGPFQIAMERDSGWLHGGKAAVRNAAGSMLRHLKSWAGHVAGSPLPHVGHGEDRTHGASTGPPRKTRPAIQGG